MGNTVASQQDGPGFKAIIWARPFCVSVWSLLVLPMSGCVLSGYPGFPLQSKDMQLVGLGLNVRVNDCMSVCVSRATDLSRVYCPMVAGIHPRPH